MRMDGRRVSRDGHHYPRDSFGSAPAHTNRLPDTSQSLTFDHKTHSA